MKTREASDPLLSNVKDYEALDSIWSALEADPGFLASRLRDRSASPEEMRVAADLIEGLIKPRRVRSGSPTRDKRFAIAKFVAFLERVCPHLQRKAIVAWAAEEHKVSQRFVYNVLQEFDGNALAQCERMYRNSTGHGEEPTLDAERRERLRCLLEGASHDILIEIIEGFIARELARN